MITKASTTDRAPVGRKPVVLVVDDDVHIRLLVQLLLQGRGMSVVLAADGAQALEQARASQPALIILDVTMPGMSGYDTCKALRNDPLLKRTPVLMLTAHGSTADKVAGFEAGADDYVQKPFEGAELAARVQALLARSSLYQPEVAGPTPPEGKLIAVVGAKGGVGTSTLATSLALLTDTLWSGGELRPAVLVDLDLVHGHVAPMLGLDPRRTLPDLTGRGSLALDRDFLLQFVEQHSGGLAVLPGPRSPVDGEHVTTDLLKALWPVCKACFSYSFVDLPPAFGEATLSAFDAADLILVVISPEITAVRSAVQIMAAFQALSLPSDRWLFVLNRPLDAGDLPLPSIERTLRRTVLQSLPNAGTRILEANNRGEPLVLRQPGHPFSAAIEELAVRLVRAAPVTSAASGAPTERVGRIERRLKR